jgi:hypothetical protein
MWQGSKVKTKKYMSITKKIAENNKIKILTSQILLLFTICDIPVELYWY